MLNLICSQPSVWLLAVICLYAGLDKAYRIWRAR